MRGLKPGRLVTRPQPKRHKSMTSGSSISACYIAWLDMVLHGELKP
jgi:hypothetical protein